MSVDSSSIEQPRRNDQFNLKSYINTVRDVGATILVISPVFVAFKAMWISHFNFEIASALVSSLDISKYIQIIAIYTLSPLLLVAGTALIYAQGREFHSRGPRGKLSEVVIVVVVFNFFLIAPLLPQSVFGSLGFAVGASLAIMLGLALPVMAMGRRSSSAAASISLLEVGCLLVGIGLLASDFESSQPASIFIPFAFLFGGLGKAYEPAAKMVRNFFFGFGGLLVLGNALGAGLWVSPEVVKMNGVLETIYVLDTDDGYSLIYIRSANALNRVGAASIENRQLCYYPRETLLSTLRPVTVGMPVCPD